MSATNEAQIIAQWLDQELLSQSHAALLTKISTMYYSRLETEDDFAEVKRKNANNWTFLLRLANKRRKETCYQN